MENVAVRIKVIFGEDGNGFAQGVRIITWHEGVNLPAQEREKTFWEKLEMRRGREMKIKLKLVW